MYCPAVDTHFKLVDHVVSGADFRTSGVFECDTAHRRSVAVLCMLYKIKIRCNPMHPLSGALPVPYVSMLVTRDALVAHWYPYSPPRSKTSHADLSPFIPLSVILWNYLTDPVFVGVGLVGFKSRVNAFLFV